MPKKSTKSIKTKAGKQNRLSSYQVGPISYEHLVNLKKEIKSGLTKSKTNLTKAGLIKFFELAYEQSWKILKRILMSNYSIEALGSRDVFRESARVGLIRDCEKWLDFVEDRNQTVHTYDADTADLIVSDLDDFVEELEDLIDKLSKLK